jgi:hypothetical protein
VLLLLLLLQVWTAGNPQYGQLGGGTDHMYNAKDSEWQQTGWLAGWVAGWLARSTACSAALLLMCCEAGNSLRLQTNMKDRQFGARNHG